MGGRWVSAAAGGGRLRLQGAAAEGRRGAPEGKMNFVGETSVEE